MIQHAQTPWGEVRLAGSGFQLEHGNGGIDKPIARPGEHSAAILASIGYDASSIASLCAKGVTATID
jgi:crotonobetainyl-CoA:carnitine CoA-transferase CaiB-like acyl-CoA transferase